MKAEIIPLTGLRFYAALWVFLYHLGDIFIEVLFPSIWPIYKTLFYGGGMGVDVFFVLSGFILAYNYLDQQDHFQTKHYLPFLYKRFARIYPAHFATLIVMLAASFFISKGDFFVFGSFTELLKNIFLVQSLFPPVTWNVVSWSVSCEMIAYIAFPIFIFCTRPIDSNQKIIVGMATIYILTVISIAYCTINNFDIVHPLFSFTRIISEFTVGLLIFKLWQLNRSLKLSRSFTHMIFPIIFIAALLSSHLLISFLWIVPLACFMIYLSVNNQFFLNKHLTRPLVVYGGKISYSLYLAHGVALMIVVKLFDLEAFAESAFSIRLGIIISFVVMSAVLTLSLYHWVEKPAQSALLAFYHR